MLIQGKCNNCETTLGVIQHSNHYYCERHFGYYICVNCYNSGVTSHPICGTNLKFHSSSDTLNKQRDNNILY
jgi:hypothetical protein